MFRRKNAKALAKEVHHTLLPYKKATLSKTSDNGIEFFERRQTAKKSSPDFFFSQPRSSRQRGLNENASVLIEQCIPEKQSFNNCNDERILFFQHEN
jgi:IS30 family transposase